MRILRLYTEDLSVDVQYKTDLITETQDNFTVMSIEGLDDAEKELGIDFKQLPYNINIFKEFAENNGLGLSVQTVGSATDSEAVILVEPKEEEEDPEDPDDGDDTDPEEGD